MREAAADQPEDDSDTSSDAPLLSLEPSGQIVQLPEALFWRVAWRVIPLPWLGYVLNIVDRTNLGYAQLQMGHDIGLSARDFGFASGIFFVAYATMQVPANHLIGDPSVGAARVLAASMVLWGASAAATSCIQTPSQLYALRFALGVSESAFFPGVLLYLTRWFPEATSGRAMAWFASAASVGGMIASAGSGALLSGLDGVLGVRGWRWLLVIEGLPTILLGLITFALLDERPQDATWLQPNERAALVSALESDEHRRRAELVKSCALNAPAAVPSRRQSGAPASCAPPLPPPSPPPSPPQLQSPAAAPIHAAPRPLLRRTLHVTLFTTPCAIFCVQYAASAAIANTSRSFLPTLLSEVLLTWSPWSIGLICALPAALKVALSPPIAGWADCGGSRRRFFASWGLYACSAVLLVISGTGMLLGGKLGSGPPVMLALVPIVLLAAADVLCQIAIPIFWSLHHSTQPAALRGCSIALTNSIGNGVGGFLGPVILGAAHDAVKRGSACRGGACDHVAAQWGAGTLLLGSATLIVTTVSAAVLRARRPSLLARGGGARSKAMSHGPCP